MKPRLSLAAACALALLGKFATPLRAQIFYANDIALPSGHGLIVPLSGMTTPSLATPQVLATTNAMYKLNPTTNAFDVFLSQPPAGVRFNPFSLMTYYDDARFSVPDSLLMLGAQRQLYLFNFSTTNFQGAQMDRSPSSSAVNSLATNADSSRTAFVTNNQIYLLDPTQTTGSAPSTLLVSNTANGGQLGTVGKGVFGPDGYFYLLDQINGTTRVEAYDVSDGLAEADRFKGSFNVTGIGSLAAGLAISPTGHVYIGDGAGGFVEYDLNGHRLGSATFTGTGTPDNNGADYIDLDRVGRIYVYDPATGLHVYFDPTGMSLTSAVVSLNDGQTNSSGYTVAAGGLLPFEVDSGTATQSGGVSGSGDLLKLGAGALTLTAANTYTGVTTIAAGTLQLAGSGKLPGSTALTISSGAVYDLNGLSSTVGSLAGSGNITLGSGALTVGTNGISTAFSGVVSGSGRLVKTGAGTLTLSGLNTYTGGTALDAGTLALGSAGALGPSGPISFGGGTLQFSANNTTDYSARFSSAPNQAYNLDTNGQSVTLGTALTSTGGSLTKLGAGTLVLIAANTYDGPTTVVGGTLQLGSGGTTGSVAGDLVVQDTLVFNRSDTVTYGGVISAGGSVTQAGPGTLTLTGANTYSGGTAVSAGALFVNGSLANTAVTINSGATLGGSGSIGGPTTLAAGAHLAPGTSPGTLTFTNGLTLTAGAILDFQLGTTSDLVRVTGGALASNSGVVLNLSDAGGFAAGTYPLFDFHVGSVDATHFVTTDFTLGTAPAGYIYSLSLAGSTLQLTASPIPEPSTCAALAGLGALGLALFRRRKPPD